VVVMVHGGCWTASVANRTIMNYIAEDLRQHGVAVWNIEYRGVDQPGGGYPGTFLDVAHGADALRGVAASHHLRLNRIVAFGHSAGGHFVFWLAARPKLAPASPLYIANPLRIDTAISSGGLPDLAYDRDVGERAACGTDVIAQLVGAPGPQHPDVFADTS